jgi:hypothetical protein
MVRVQCSAWICIHLIPPIDRRSNGAEAINSKRCRCFNLDRSQLDHRFTTHHPHLVVADVSAAWCPRWWPCRSHVVRPIWAPSTSIEGPYAQNGQRRNRLGTHRRQRRWPGSGPRHQADLRRQINCGEEFPATPTHTARAYPLKTLHVHQRSSYAISLVWDWQRMSNTPTATSGRGDCGGSARSHGGAQGPKGRNVDHGLWVEEGLRLWVVSRGGGAQGPKWFWRHFWSEHGWSLI